MKQYQGRRISAAILSCSFMTPLSATVIYEDLYKKLPSQLQTISTPSTDFTTDNSLNSLSVDNIFYSHSELSPPTLSVRQPYETFSSLSSYSFYNTERFTTQYSEQAHFLSVSDKLCDHRIYENISFAKTTLYFSAPLYNTESLNFRMWKSLSAGHMEWDSIPDTNTANTPKPLSIGALGIGMVSFASLKKRHQQHS